MNESKSESSQEALGLTDQEKFDTKTPLRGQTGDDSGQRPTHTTKSMKTDKGTFKFKG